MTDVTKLINEWNTISKLATDGPWEMGMEVDDEDLEIYRIYGDDKSHEAILCEAWSAEHNNEANIKAICFLRNSADTIFFLLQDQKLQIERLEKEKKDLQQTIELIKRIANG